MPENKFSPKPRWSVRSIAICALLTALSVILARLLIPMPNETTRFSIEAVPIFIAGMLFGPLPGALTGFAADFIGCLFTPYGYNPIFCVPPMLYGLSAGLFRPWLTQKVSPLRIAVAFLPAIVLGSILYQSGSLALIYGGESKMAFFLAKLATRSGTQVIYLKQNEQISDFLTFLGASVASMGIIEARLEHELNNQVNRRCNCDDANITKVVEASREQMNAIRTLREQNRFDALPDKLKQAALVREENPESSLAELASLVEPQISKPAMSHRLKRLVELAEEGSI